MHRKYHFFFFFFDRQAIVLKSKKGPQGAYREYTTRKPKPSKEKGPKEPKTKQNTKPALWNIENISSERMFNIEQ